MPTPSSGGEDGRDAADQGRRFDDDVFPPPRPRASAARILVLTVASIIVSALLFRVAVEAVRMLAAP